MIGSQNNDRGQITSIDSITNCSMNFYQTDKCKSFLCKLGMRFTKMGCNNVTKCIIPLWIVGWNNVGKIQPAINVAAGVAHLAQSSSGQPQAEERRGACHNISSCEQLTGHRELKSVYSYHPMNCQYSLLIFSDSKEGTR